jgi:hypothetical protein
MIQGTQVQTKYLPRGIELNALVPRLLGEAAVPTPVDIRADIYLSIILGQYVYRPAVNHEMGKELTPPSTRFCRPLASVTDTIVLPESFSERFSAGAAATSERRQAKTTPVRMMKIQ